MRAIRDADDKLDASGTLERCQSDPIFFSRHVLGGEQPWGRQVEIMRSICDRTRVAVPSGFCVGKTWCAARIALWFLFCFPSSLVITTAPTWRQVENVLWSEVRRQHADSSVRLGGEVLRTQIRIAPDWFALGLSTDEPERFQGFHSAHLLMIFDEAAGVDRRVWDVAEGQMAGAHSRWLAIGNPVQPSGPFYDACLSELWHTLPISCLDTPNVSAGRVIYPKLVTGQWVEERRTEWGEESPLYQAKVLGQFPSSSEAGLIPLSWVLAANERAAGSEAKEHSERSELRVGVDVARSGADSTVFLLRDPWRVLEIKEFRGLSTMETVGHLRMFTERHHVPWHCIYVDVIGIGAGVVDRLRELGRSVCGVNFGSGPRDTSRYANLRAECYWKLREALRPDGESPLAIGARFGRLCSEIAAIQWSVNSSGKVLVEPKEKIKGRIGRSPDHADALALTYALPTYDSGPIYRSLQRRTDFTCL